MHRSIVDAGSLVDVDIESVVGSSICGEVCTAFSTGVIEALSQTIGIDLLLIGAVLVEAATLVK